MKYIFSLMNVYVLFCICIGLQFYSHAFEKKEPALLISFVNIPLSGLESINGITPSSNTRVLLIGQTDPRENGLWLTQTGPWIRPNDFASGSQTGQASIQILLQPNSTTINSQWLCSSPTSIIDTDPITFAPCLCTTSSQSSDINATNVGSGTGQLFRDKTSNTLNFKTIAVAAHLLLNNNTNDISLSTDATDSNLPNTTVARNINGDFNASTITASLNGVASQNVLKAGDTMTGVLTIPSGNAASPSLQFSGSTNTGISAPTANTLSFDTNGTECMKISSSLITHLLPTAHNNVVCEQAIQSVVPTNNGTVSVNSGVSILLLKHTTSTTNFTIVFPPNPINGQIFTILLGTSNSITINNVGGAGGASIVNQIVKLNPASAQTASSNGSAVSYFYSGSANSWYRLARG